jgi:hypothetical protein
MGQCLVCTISYFANFFFEECNIFVCKIMYIFVMRARIGLKTLPIDRIWFCTSIVVYNNNTKCFYSLVASCQSGTTGTFSDLAFFRVNHFSLISHKE